MSIIQKIAYISHNNKMADTILEAVSDQPYLGVIISNNPPTHGQHMLNESQAVWTRTMAHGLRPYMFVVTGAIWSTGAFSHAKETFLGQRRNQGLLMHD